MLLLCSSCNSKYLVNSADLKPDGRLVKCAKCNNEWYQEAPKIENDDLETLVLEKSQNEKNIESQNISYKSNLPSTYNQKEQYSLINSLLVILLLILLSILIWFINKEGFSIIALLFYYINEFYFNLKLIINDLAKLLNQMINF